MRGLEFWRFRGLEGQLCTCRFAQLLRQLATGLLDFLQKNRQGVLKFMKNADDQRLVVLNAIDQQIPSDGQVSIIAEDLSA